MCPKKNFKNTILAASFFVASFLPALVFGQSADEEYESIIGLMQKEAAPEATNREKVDFVNERNIEFLEKALTFGSKYPEDKRYWHLIVQSGYTAPLFITGFRPGIDEAEGRVIWNFVEQDPDKVMAFRKLHEQRLELLFEQEGLDQYLLVGAYGWMLTNLEQDAWKEPSAENRKAYQEMMHRYWNSMPDNEYVASAAESYLRLLEEQAPDEVDAFKEELNSSSNKFLSSWLAEKAKSEEALLEIGNLKFTALDGSEVDLGTMRGRVILVDFWATWCGPCIAEIPNVVSAYEKYHDKGFEVIGVSLDNAAHEQKLRNFVAEKGMPWPQYFDGKAWKSDLVIQYGIKAIPAMILVGPDGSIASTSARGEALAPAIEELLGL